MKITQWTLKEVMYDSFFHSFEGTITDPVKQLEKVISDCKTRNEAFTMSRSVQKIYKELQTN
jgi:hypothetical protein